MTTGNELILGIDLGTTYSCAAYVDQGYPRIIPSEKGYTTIPSVVGLNRKGEVVVGHPAVDQMVTKPENTIYGAKRLIGRKYNSLLVQEMREYMSYTIVEGSNGEAAVTLGDQKFDLSQISAFILSEIRDFAESMLEKKVLRAIVTVPAYYNDNQRQAVKRAGALAGLEVARIVNEPTAAAVAYGFKKGFEQKILVYDFGGGTFDVSVLMVRGNEFEVLATGGDTFLGGVDVDNRITGFALEKFQDATGKDLVQEKVAMQRLRTAAEQCKRDLSSQKAVELVLPFITEVKGQPIDMRLKLSRVQLDRLASDLVDRTLTMCDTVLASVGLKGSDIDEVLLVGGQTRMPLIRERITKHFGKPPRKGVHPEEVVAQGAAILGNPGSISTVVLKDVLSIPIGIALAGGKFKVILDRNTPLPASRVYKVNHTRKDMLVIDIFQGEKPRILENEYLGTFCFPEPEPGKKGGRTLEMRFKLSAECLLKVYVRDLETGERSSVEMVTMQTPKSISDNIEGRNRSTGQGGWFKSIADRFTGRTG